MPQRNMKTRLSAGSFFVLQSKPLRTEVIPPPARASFILCIEIRLFNRNKKSERLSYSENVRMIRMVGVTGFEPAASCSQSRRATNCATPRKYKSPLLSIFCLLCSPSPVAWSPRVTRRLAPAALRLAAYHGVRTHHTVVFLLVHPKQARYQLRYTPFVFALHHILFYLS